MLDLHFYIDAGETHVSNLIIKYYKKLAMSETELIFFLQLLQFQQQNNLFPDISIIAERMECDVTQLFNIAQSLIDKGIISLQTQRTAEGKTADIYNLAAVYDKLDIILKREEKRQEFASHEEAVRDLFQQFEKEFGRLLSPIEIETINLWINEDKYDVDVIRLALKEAVLNQAYSLKYIDRILISWERKNLKSAQQISDDIKQRKNMILEKNSQKEVVRRSIPKVPLYDWLHPENNEIE